MSAQVLQPTHPTNSMDSGIALTDNLSASKSTNQHYDEPLQVDFTWTKFKATVRPRSAPTSVPIYEIQCRAFSPQYVFTSPSNNNEKLGTGTIHPVRIHANCSVRGREIELKPLKRWQTKYTYQSLAFSREDGSKAILTWEGTCGLKKWDFVCLDEQQLPVAKVSVNVWGVHDMGSIEFMSPGDFTEAMRDEIVVTGVTLYQQMLLRSSNFFNFAGAFFAKPGPIKEAKKNAHIE